MDYIHRRANLGKSLSTTSSSIGFTKIYFLTQYMKKSFMLYQDSLDVLDAMTDAQCWKLLRLMRSHHNGKEYCSGDQIVDIAFIPFKNQFDRDIEKSRCGKYHWNRKGGITSENKTIRNSTEYKTWREDVFKRDEYCCQYCWRVGWELNAHHIKEFAKYPDLRLDISNWQTLCKSCHILAHKS